MDIENFNIAQVLDEGSFIEDLERVNHQFGYGYNKSDKNAERKSMFSNEKRNVRVLAKEEKEGYNGYTEIEY
jgi:hypothetical protein